MLSIRSNERTSSAESSYKEMDEMTFSSKNYSEEKGERVSSARGSSKESASAHYSRSVYPSRSISSRDSKEEVLHCDSRSSSKPARETAPSLDRSGNKEMRKGYSLPRKPSNDTSHRVSSRSLSGQPRTGRDIKQTTDTEFDGTDVSETDIWQFDLTERDTKFDDAERDRKQSEYRGGDSNVFEDTERHRRQSDDIESDRNQSDERETDVRSADITRDRVIAPSTSSKRPTSRVVLPSFYHHAKEKEQLAIGRPGSREAKERTSYSRSSKEERKRPPSTTLSRNQRFSNCNDNHPAVSKSDSSQGSGVNDEAENLSRAYQNNELGRGISALLDRSKPSWIPSLPSVKRQSSCKKKKGRGRHSSADGRIQNKESLDSKGKRAKASSDNSDDCNENRPAKESLSGRVDPPSTLYMDVWAAAAFIEDVSRSTPEQRVYNEEKKRTLYYWKPLLRGVTGLAQPGSLLAIMGCSGSGKTTLLNALAGRSTSGCRVTGKVKVNGIEVKAETMRQLSAYVPQQDLLLPDLTVKETLAFRATLEMRNCSNRRRVERVVDILKDMNLVHCANYRIGEYGKKKGDWTGISASEAKRLSIACELLRNPSVVFCDEPFLGLTASAAEHVVGVLERLASRRHTVLCTVTQPSSRVFAHFNKVLLLTEGRLAFLGSSTDAMSFFTSHGEVCPPHINPADFFVQALNVTGPPAYVKLKAEVISQSFNNTFQAQAMKMIITDLTISANNSVDNRNGNDTQRLIAASVHLPAAWSTQFRVNLWRCWLTLTRNKCKVICQFLSLVIFCMMVGFFFYEDRNGKYDPRTVLDVNGAIFVIVLVMCLSHYGFTVSILPRWLPFLLEECGNLKLYRADAFYWALVLTYLPFDLVYPLVSAPVLLSLTGLDLEPTGFLLAMTILLLAANVSGAFGLLWSAYRADGGGTEGTVVLPLVLAAGYVVNLASLPSWLSWLTKLSWFRHATELLMVNQWVGVSTIHCTPFLNLPDQNGSLPGDPNNDTTTDQTTSSVNTSFLGGSVFSGFAKNEADNSRAGNAAIVVKGGQDTNGSSAALDAVFQALSGSPDKAAIPTVVADNSRLPPTHPLTPLNQTNSTGANLLEDSGCLFRRGEDVLGHFGFSADHCLMNWAWLAGLLVLFRVVAFLALRRYVRKASQES